MNWRNKHWLFEEYVTKRKSMRTISREEGCGETVIHKWLHRFGIPIRSRSEALRGLQKSEEHKNKLAIWASQRIGNKNSNWKNGSYRDNIRKRGIGWRQRKRQVLERDNYECQICGIDIDLHIHHIKSVKDFPELVNDISNCVVICKKCHYNIHFHKENLANSVKTRTVNAEPSTTSEVMWNPDWMSSSTDLGACVETIYEKSLKRDYDIVRL